MDYYESVTNPAFSLDDVTAGAATSSPLSDVSNSSEPMATWTPTGTGTGAYLDTTAQQQLVGGLVGALNYAVQRDAIKMGMPYNGQMAGATGQQLQVQRKQTNGMFMLLVGLGIFLAVRE